MDEKQIELAEMYTAQELNASIERVRAGLVPKKPDGFDGLHCVDCSEEIVEVRRSYGFFRCTDCQSKKEKMDKLGLSR
jgi:RNA polymerase-binding transcription factor DksA